MLPEAFRKVGNIVTFGRFEQDNNQTNGAEDIEWIVLAVQNGKSLLISKDILALRPFHDGKDAEVYWQDCSLREWLNGPFLEEAFSSGERARIPETAVDNSRAQDNTRYHFISDDAPDTVDRVFILSYAEYITYLKNEKWRSANSSAAVNAARKSKTDNGFWWLRSPGVTRRYVMFVRTNGKIRNDSYKVPGSTLVGVRPAIWVEN